MTYLPQRSPQHSQLLSYLPHECLLKHPTLLHEVFHHNVNGTFGEGTHRMHERTKSKKRCRGGRT